MPFEIVNPPQNFSDPPKSCSNFTLAADPGTDLWRKPPSTHSFSAPILYHRLPLSSLRRARISFSGPWRTLYDQGGLCLILPAQGKSAAEIPKDRHTKWVKTGVEFTHEAPHISTVACDRWADWSLVPLEGETLTVEMEREVKGTEKTSTLWIYAVGPDESRRPLREITWVFEGVDDGDGGSGESKQECWVGAYIAKPNKSSDGQEIQLEVKFWDMAIETWDGPIDR